MKIKIIVTSVVVMLSSSLAMGADSTVPAESMGAIGVFIAHEKFRIYSASCGEVDRGSKATYDFVASAFTARLQRLGADVLATDEFKTMAAQPVPSSLVEAVRADLDATRLFHISKATNAPTSCKAAHENFIAADDNHWRAGIVGLLTELRATGRPPGAAPSVDTL